jgi:pyridoxine 4-dehydrogenase
MAQELLSYSIKGTDLRLNRLGYGAMRLTGPGVLGPPKDEKEAIAVLKTAIELGVNHIDTSDYYGPYVTNQMIRKALSPYPKDLTIVTKVGYKRTTDGKWVPALSDEDLTSAVHDNLKRLGLETMQIVNLRVDHTAGPDSVTFERALRVLADLKKKGLVQHLGVSNVTAEQYAFAKKITPIVCVQNEFNVFNRRDDSFVNSLAEEGVAYVPYFPLGGFQPFQSLVLDEVAKELHATSMQVAIAWLLERSKNILTIPGTSSVAHLRENMAAGKLTLSPNVLERLNGLSKK